MQMGSEGGLVVGAEVGDSSTLLVQYRAKAPAAKSNNRDVDRQPQILLLRFVDMFILLCSRAIVSCFVGG
jgi:hypothetical protein